MAVDVGCGVGVHVTSKPPRHSPHLRRRLHLDGLGSEFIVSERPMSAAQLILGGGPAWIDSDAV